MKEVTFVFTSWAIPVLYKADTKITEEGITRKGEFSELTLRMLMDLSESVTNPDPNFAITTSQLGIEVTAHIESEEKEFEGYECPDFVSLTVSDPDGLLEIFDSYFGEYFRGFVSEVEGMRVYDFDHILTDRGEDSEV